MIVVQIASVLRKVSLSANTFRHLEFFELSLRRTEATRRKTNKVLVEFYKLRKSPKN
jgi:hypothetical protein